MNAARPGSRQALLTDDRLTYSVPEVANILNIGRSSAYRAARLGQIKTMKLSGRMVVTRTAVMALLGLVDAEHQHPDPPAAITTSRPKQAHNLPPLDA